MNILLLGVISAAAILLIIKQPGYGFMVGLAIFYNIGGYFYFYTLGFPGFFTIMDFGLVFATIAALANRVIQKKIVFDNNFVSLLIVCLFFSIYQIIVSIWMKLDITNLTVLLKEIAYHKWRIFGVFFAVPTYYAIQDYSKEIYKSIVFVTFVIIAFYYITLFSGINLIEIVSEARGLGIEVLRRSIRQYGFMLIVIPLAIMAIFVKTQIANKKMLIIGAVGMFIAELLTLTRISIVSLVGTVFITIVIINKYFGVKISRAVFRSLGFVFIGLLITLYVFPNVLSSVFKVYEMTFLEVIGKLPRGTSDSRSTIEYARMAPLLVDHFWLGTGCLKDYFSSYRTIYELGLADFPLLGNLAMYGILGFSLYLLRYVYIFKRIRIFLKEHNAKSLLDSLSNYELLLFFWGVIAFMALIFAQFIYFSKDLVYNWFSIDKGFMIGVIYGLTHKFNRLQRGLNRYSGGIQKAQVRADSR